MLRKNTNRSTAKSLLFISLSSKKTLDNSIHADILAGLSKRFDKVSVLCLGSRSREKRENLTYLSGTIQDWFSYLRREPKTKYIYINDFFVGGFVGVVIKFLWGSKLVLRCGSPWKYDLSSFSSFLKTLAVGFTKPLVIKSCDKIVYNSKALVQRQYKHDWDVAHNGVDTDLFKPIEEMKCLAEDKLNLVFVGNLNREKGLDYLFLAIKVLQDKINLTIVGDGPLFLDYKSKFPFVNFVGRVRKEKIVEIINQHDLLIHPSYVESLPNVVLEAMACGKPVIAADVYGVPELVKEGVNGFLIPARETRSISRVIGKCIDKKEMLTAMGVEARETALMFEKKKKCEELLDKLFSGDRGAADER